MSKNKGIAEDKRRQRRLEAIERQKAYDELTPQAKLDRLGPTGSQRQRARLEKQIAEAADGR
jgi:DNA-binding protein H-NS